MYSNSILESGILIAYKAAAVIANTVAIFFVFITKASNFLSISLYILSQMLTNVNDIS